MHSTQTQSYTLPAVFDAIGASGAAMDLHPACQAGASIHIDTSQLARITTPGVQFLVALRAQCEATGTALRVSESPILFDALALLGLAQQFQLNFQKGS